MKKSRFLAIGIFVAGALFAGLTQAQQTPPPSNPQQSPATGGTQAPSTTAKKTTPSSGPKTPAKRTPAALTLKTQKDKASYAIGVNVAKGLQQNLKQGGVDVDPAILTRAIKDVFAGGTLLLTDDEQKATLTSLQAEVRKKQEDLRKAQELEMQQAGEKNKKEGEAFLADNKTKEGVITLPSGLQYKPIEEGTGPKPAAGDMVTVNYRGTLLNGTEFDSSYKRAQPANFAVGQVIKGWTEALQLMPVGSKWQLFIPSDLAYGARGAGQNIGPNATLVFEVELLSIQPKVAATPPLPAAPSATAPATKP